MNYLKTQGKEAEASPNKSNNAESADEAMNMVSKYTIFIIYYVFNQLTCLSSFIPIFQDDKSEYCDEPFENNTVKITPEKEKDATEYILSSYEKKREERA